MAGRAKRKKKVSNEELFSKDPEIREKLSEITKSFTDEVNAYLQQKEITAVVQVLFGFSQKVSQGE